MKHLIEDFVDAFDEFITSRCVIIGLLAAIAFVVGIVLSFAWALI